MTRETSKPTKTPWRFRLNLLTFVVLLIVATFAVVSRADGRTSPTTFVPASLRAETSMPAGLVICQVFRDRYCGQALRVAWCESRLDTRARNGQYRGLFQMGARERRKYGHGPTAREQARAAYRYFVASGRDWSPWQCRP